jgi:hypothetical protein
MAQFFLGKRRENFTFLTISKQLQFENMKPFSEWGDSPILVKLWIRAPDEVPLKRWYQQPHKPGSATAQNIWM